MTIDVVLKFIGLIPLEVLLPLLLYPRARGYKEGNRVSYNMIPFRTLSLRAYFTYIFIDIIMYALGSTSWSSAIFRMVGRVIADPSLGLPSPYEVVRRVLIRVSYIDELRNEIFEIALIILKKYFVNVTIDTQLFKEHVTIWLSHS
jgi:hypothetical protein